MRKPFKVKLEQAYDRHVLFAIELLDAVTMTRVSDGVEVVADGLQGKPIVNPSGQFVWLKEGLGGLQKISIKTDALPYEPREVDRAELRLPPNRHPLTTIELQPRLNYAFPAGITGLRGTLLERRITPMEPVANAEVSLRWLDDVGNWHDAPTAARTSPKGDFVSILRLAPKEKPDVDSDGAVTVRLQVRRNGSTRRSNDFKLLQGRVTDPSALNTLTFAWDELQP